MTSAPPGPQPPSPQLLIDGVLRGASGGGSFPIVNPASGEIIGYAPDAAAADTAAAIAAARRAFGRPGWADDPRFRAGCLRQLGRLIATRTDIPPGVVNVLTASRAEAGRMLASDPGVDLVSLTGSTATGRAVMAAAAPTLKKVFLELGGKSAAIVLDDYDIATAAALTAFSVCIHAGQGCALTTRLIVPRDGYGAAVEACVQTMAGVAVGDPADAATVCGPVISAGQRDRIETYLRSALADGGRFACGGGRVPGRDAGYWIEPTVITGLGNGDRAAREEIFGPVLVVLAHDGDEDAIRMANDSPYGLSGAVFGTDLDRARAVTARIRTGTVGINGGVWYSPDVPFGGYKQSGTGREMGVAGFEEYLEIKSVAEAV
jgi:aldehyde dehydrogenase (NAD+)